MTLLRWLQSLWLWIREKMEFLPRLIKSKYDDDSDYSSDEDICRVPCDSGTGIYDEVDGLPSDGAFNQSVPRTIEASLKKNNGETVVRMKNPYCVLIININFDGKMGPRNGGEADRENIKRMLDRAGFDSIHVYNDVGRKDTLEIMDQISTSTEIADHDGLLVFISSHGRKKGILATDKKIVEVDEMTSRVNGKQCEALRGKPKLFFISACRGTKIDRGVPGLVTHDACLGEKIVPRLPIQADFLVCYSTTPEHISHRRFTLGVTTSPSMGTWLISALTRVFEERMKDEDVMEMLTRVNAVVADMSSHDDHVNGTKQMPVQMFMLRHRVYLGHPERIS